ncbi:MAG: bifunctional nuclease family protein [Streptosporangiaceae bacterium]|nr:bifunctional nuclease family protein [Streptosporangiaceae bacterium]
MAEDHDECAGEAAGNGADDDHSDRRRVHRDAISKVVVAGSTEDDSFDCIVLDQVHGDRRLVIQVGSAEAFSLAATLGDTVFDRPMTYQFTAALVASLGGRVRQVRIDRVVEGAFAATVEVEGPFGVGLVDARSSDALNLAALVGAAVFTAPEVLDDCERRQQGDSAEAALLRRAPDLPPVTINRGQPPGP